MAVLGKRSESIAIADQALVSGVNLATALMLARYLSLTSYGQYALLFAVLLFINGIQSALVTSPLMILAPRFDTEPRARYLNSLAILQLAGCCILGALTTLLMLAERHWWLHVTVVIDIIPCVLVLTTYVGQDFLRRALFVEQRPVAGFGVDLVSYGLQFASIVVLVLLGSLTLSTSLWAMGLTSLLACAFGVFLLRPSLSSVTHADITVVWLRHWNQGRWLITSVLAQWGSMQLYLFLAAALLSPAATGVLAASRTLLGATHILLQGLENFVPATLTRRLAEDGTEAMVQWLSRFRRMIVLILGVYCVGVVIFAGPLMHVLFGIVHEQVGMVVAMGALGQFIAIFITTSTFALRAMDALRWLLYARLASLIVMAAISIPLVVKLDLMGAAIGMTVTQFIVFAVTHFGYRSELTAI